MNLEHPNFGQWYRLSRLAVRLRTFTISELVRLTGTVDDTVYGFVAKLLNAQQDYLQWEELPRSTPGRPVKRYTLTEAGVDHLLQRNARFAAILEGAEDAAETVIAPHEHEVEDTQAAARAAVLEAWSAAKAGKAKAATASYYKEAANES